LIAGTVQDADVGRKKQRQPKPQHHMLHALIADAVPMTGNLTFGLAGGGAAIGIGLIGAKMVEAIGRNPATLPKVLVFGLLTIALSEAMGIFGLIFGLFQGK
jgi:F-type H+-transporting ATPase subunit c